MEIKVTIPKQDYTSNKYTGYRDLCYLEDALMEAGYIARVHGNGTTIILDGIKPTFWRTVEVFDSDVVRDSLVKGKSIHVSLVRSNPGPGWLGYLKPENFDKR